MPRKLPALLTVAVLLPLAISAQTPALDTFQAKLKARFGVVALTIARNGAAQRFDLTLTDKRYLGLTKGVADSAKGVARFSMNNMPASYHPDTIIVKIVTRDSVIEGVRKTIVNTWTFGVSNLP